MVGSKLDKNLEKINDRTWLEIISNPKVAAESHHDYVQVDWNHVVESSIRQFSNSLERIAKMYPERFGKLALRFPENTPQDYIASVLKALSTDKPDSNIPDNKKNEWVCVARI